MNIEEAIKYLKENLKNWKDTRPSLSNTDIVEEVDKDYKAIETLLTAYEKEKNKEAKNLLIDMVNQFAYEDNNPKTRGSSEQKNIYCRIKHFRRCFLLIRYR